MLAELLETAMEKRRELISKIRSVQVHEDVVKSSWITYTPIPFKKVTICGVDGSMNFKEFKGFSLYALSAEAVILDNKRMNKIRLCDVDLLYPYFRTRERVKVYMLIMEVLAALRVSENVDVILLDGSIINNIVRHVPRNVDMVREIFSDNVLIDMLEEEEFNVRELINYVAFRAYGVENYILCVEFLKYLMLLKRLLEKSGDKLIAIAKTSQSTLYFKEFKPDIVIFERFTKTVGFSKPIVRKISDIIAITRNKFSDAIANFLKDIEISTFYFRLTENGPVLKAEVPMRLSYEDIKRILDVLSAYSVMGYPYPLKKAHADSDIRDQDMECILRILSAYDEKTGREQHEVGIKHWY